MRLLLTGGGTAGHINPALAIAETVKQNDPNAEIAFVGVRGKREEDLVPRAGYPLYFVQARGFRGKLPTLSNLRAAWLALTAPNAKDTQEILDTFKPDLVIGTGGYACWPLMVAAAKRGIPTAVHESNSHPGKAVRMLQGKVDRIWTNFPNTVQHLRRREKVVRVGNPLRGDFGALTREEARARLGISSDRLFILSFGGSGGAENVNRGVITMMRELSAKNPAILHMHATGKADFEASMLAFREAGLDEVQNCILKDYIYDMPLCMVAADLIISRAGAMTLSELALLHKACVLIPSPNVAYNHQVLNATELGRAGAAKVLDDDAVTKEGVLASAVQEILTDGTLRHSMEEKIVAFADPEANRRIWEEIGALLKTH
ncbi:MAG: UDP-N-acetylglucosamine--N-acetylmuramyl-(pentapeptide) pyrophosphoryl-undecaprenol N-acetylglucosamine transferase [Ruminococcaceae bacterium]|nr:UDP-N-acetylglucosamine--N-acetylmuramyl-(pentapeptide) pyrophosphoryl-undecaprenol N-acetylglucosamine transferase [Oscillospiraceae bacterium]